ncbi:uncharacterized protein B0H64DRAFT_384618, partial [Chaetomium fimeti]
MRPTNPINVLPFQPCSVMLSLLWNILGMRAMVFSLVCSTMPDNLIFPPFHTRIWNVLPNRAPPGGLAHRHLGGPARGV